MLVFHIYVHSIATIRLKWCVFLGFSNLHHGFKCLNISTNKIFISRHVIFDDTSFLFASRATQSNTFHSTPSPLTHLPLSLIQNEQHHNTQPSLHTLKFHLTKRHRLLLLSQILHLSPWVTNILHLKPLHGQLRHIPLLKLHYHYPLNRLTPVTLL